MTVRARIGQTLESAIGPGRTDWIRTRERRIRRRTARWLQPEPAATAPRRKSRWEPNGQHADFPAPECGHYDFLAMVHERLVPRTYLEVGVRTGQSLALSSGRSVGVDPAYSVTAEIHCDVQLVRDLSDDFFARPDAAAHFGGMPVDLALIDGMHLSEFALRDFMNVEKLMAPTGVIVFDDVLPRNVLEAARDRRTKAWTGDVYKVLDILREQRPDLTVIEVNTSATGTALVLGADPASSVLEDNYAANLELCLAGDPQVVPDRVLSRERAVPVSRLWESEAWSMLLDLRESGAPGELRDVLGRLSSLTG